MYGIIDTTRHANDAHARYKPGPVDITIPSGTWPLGGPTTMPSKALHFWMRTVQMAAPESTRILERMAEPVERKNAHVCLTAPLGGQVSLRINETKKYGTYVSRDIVAHIEPSNSK